MQEPLEVIRFSSKTMRSDYKILPYRVYRTIFWLYLLVCAVAASLPFTVARAFWLTHIVPLTIALGAVALFLF